MLQPLGDKVLVELSQEPQKVGSIFLSESVSKDTVKGVISAVGPGERSVQTGEVLPMSVKVGDTVLLSSYVGNDFKLDNKEYKLVKENELLGVL